MTQNPKCPKCGETHVIKYGKIQEKQRVICKHCNQNDRTIFAKFRVNGTPKDILGEIWPLPIDTPYFWSCTIVIVIGEYFYEKLWRKNTIE